MSLLRSPVAFARRVVLHFHPRYAPFLPDRHLPWRVPGGWMYLNVRESPAMMARALWGYEPEKTEVIRSIVQPGQTFVDVGANKGDFTLLAARRVGPTGRVLAFEPEPSNVRWLRRSIERNGYTNVEVHELALGDEEGHVTLHLGEKSGWHTIVPGRRTSLGAVQVPLRRLDDVLDGRPIDHLKIDVEGAEMAVLRGAEGTLRASPRVAALVDVHPDMGVEVQDVRDLLESMGFSVFAMRLPLGSPLEDPEAAREVLALKGYDLG